MAKSKFQKDLVHQISFLEDEIETLRDNAKQDDRAVIENLAFILNEINIGKRALVNIPKKNWITDNGKGPTFIPLVQQIHRMIKDANKILRSFGYTSDGNTVPDLHIRK
ncbi:hypothetical protein ACFL43_06895, partial [Thermodesulfobacteriota bacterium]